MQFSTIFTSLLLAGTTLATALPEADRESILFHSLSHILDILTTKSILRTARSVQETILQSQMSRRNVSLPFDNFMYTVQSKRK